MKSFNKNLIQQTRIQQGFSLIEVMITTAIIAILATLSVHYFSNLYKSYLANQFITSFWQALKHQPQSAIGMQKDLVMLPINNNWLNGWQVFIDEDQDQIFDNNEQIIQKASNAKTFPQLQVNMIRNSFSCFRFASGGIIRQCGSNAQLINQGTIQIAALNDASCSGAYELVLFQNIPRICKLQPRNSNCECIS